MGKFPELSEERRELIVITALQEFAEKGSLTISEAGVNREEFESKVARLAQEAYQGQTSTTNPRMPLIRELEEIYRNAF